MSTRIIRFLLTQAGPEAAKILATAILQVLEDVTDKTETELDDRIIAYVIEQLEKVDLIDISE